MVTKTATNDFHYGKNFYGKTLDELVDYVHKKTSQQLHWKYKKLKRGSFGYDSFAMSIGFSLMNISSNIKDGASIIHSAWIRNYLFWTYVKPYEILPNHYIKPSKPIDDKRRKNLAKKSYEELENNEKQINELIFIILYDYLDIDYDGKQITDNFID